MNTVQQEILQILLQVLLDRELITREVHDQARSRIWETKEWPEFFGGGEEKTDGGA